MFYLTLNEDISSNLARILKQDGGLVYFLFNLPFEVFVLKPIANRLFCPDQQTPTM